jgi:hypothetical protein
MPRRKYVGRCFFCDHAEDTDHPEAWLENHKKHCRDYINQAERLKAENDELKRKVHDRKIKNSGGVLMKALLWVKNLWNAIKARSRI